MPSPFFLLLSLSTFIFPLSLSTTIPTLCKSTQYPLTCQNTLQSPNPGPSPGPLPSPAQLIQTTLSLTTHHLKKAQSMAHKIITTFPNHHNRTMASYTCLDLLSLSSYRTRTSLKSLSSRDNVVDARAWGSAALTYVYDCWSELSYVNGTRVVDEMMVFLSSSVVETCSNAVSLLHALVNYGDDVKKWPQHSPRTERDGFWEGRNGPGPGPKSKFGFEYGKIGFGPEPRPKSRLRDRSNGLGPGSKSGPGFGFWDKSNGLGPGPKSELGFGPGSEFWDRSNGFGPKSELRPKSDPGFGFWDRNNGLRPGPKSNGLRPGPKSRFWDRSNELGPGPKTGLKFGPGFGFENVNVNATVCKEGKARGCYVKVQDAVNDAPAWLKVNMRGKYVIYIKEGVYEEKVRVPLEKRNLVFIGDGKGKTVITGSVNTGVMGISTYNTATVGIKGDGFMASGITFQNSAGPNSHQAVAFRSDSDFSLIENCEFLGNQDTLYAHSLRQVYRSCHIEGNVDFIFGNAAAIFQDCTILVRPRQVDPTKGENNAISAQGRTDPAEATGFVFLDCTIDGTNEYNKLRRENPKVHKTFLGRPWKVYSRTMFISCLMEDLITPEGWMPFRENLGLSTLYYGEFGNKGPGADTSKRVWWSSRIPEAHLGSYSAQNFLQANEWISGL